ncbi:hypothetical protein LTS10_000495 [Elasticomyces elasticus]|nr:hypothetical protein LTS10_000495 [Elasticomyces elasticus]
MDDASGSETVCHLLALPAELRERIYQLLVVSAHPITIHIPMKGPASNDCTIPEPELLFVNRQIRFEVLSVYYGNNTFQSFYPQPMTAWLERLSVEKISLLRKVRPFESGAWRRGDGKIEFDMQTQRFDMLSKLARFVAAHGRDVLEKDAVSGPVREGHKWERVHAGQAEKEGCRVGDAAVALKLDREWEVVMNRRKSE